MLSEVRSKCGVRGRTELHEQVSTMDENENPKGGEADGPQRRTEDAIISTPRQ